MREIGYIVVGLDFGYALAGSTSRHGYIFTRNESISHIGLAFVMWTILVFSGKSR